MGKLAMVLIAAIIAITLAIATTSTQSTVKCPYPTCKKSVAKTATSCKHCKKKFVTCQKCKRPNAVDSKFCIYGCGQLPPSVVAIEICKSSGLRANPYCTDKIKKHLPRSTITAECTQHKKITLITIKVCKDSGGKATQYCTITNEKQIDSTRLLASCHLHTEPPTVSIVLCNESRLRASKYCVDTTEDQLPSTKTLETCQDHNQSTALSTLSSDMQRLIPSIYAARSDGSAYILGGRIQTLQGLGESQIDKGSFVLNYRSLSYSRKSTYFFDQYSSFDFRANVSRSPTSLFPDYATAPDIVTFRTNGVARLFTDRSYTGNLDNFSRCDIADSISPDQKPIYAVSIRLPLSVEFKHKLRFDQARFASVGYRVAVRDGFAEGFELRFLGEEYGGSLSWTDSSQAASFVIGFESKDDSRKFRDLFNKYIKFLRA